LPRHAFLSSLPATVGSLIYDRDLKSIYETKARCRHFRVQIITSDKVKTQAYCDLNKLYDQLKAVHQKTDTKRAETLTNQASELIYRLGPEYLKLMDGLEQVDRKSSDAKEFMSILSELDKRCTK